MGNFTGSNSTTCHRFIVDLGTRIEVEFGLLADPAERKDENIPGKMDRQTVGVRLVIGAY